MNVETILIVDDDLNHQQKLGKRARLAGYEPRFAGDLPEAIKMLEEGVSDYMVLDAGFPIKIETLRGETLRMTNLLLNKIDSTGDLLIQLMQGKGLHLPRVILTNSDLPQAANIIGQTIGPDAEVICSPAKNDTTSWDQFIETCHKIKTK